MMIGRRRPLPSARLAAVSVAVLLAAGIAVGNAQQTPPVGPAAPPKSATPKQPQPGPAAPKKQAAPPAAPAAPPAAGAPQSQQTVLVFSPWLKVCGKDPQEPNAKEVCQTL